VLCNTRYIPSIREISTPYEKYPLHTRYIHSIRHWLFDLQPSINVCSLSLFVRAATSLPPAHSSLIFPARSFPDCLWRRWSNSWISGSDFPSSSVARWRLYCHSIILLLASYDSVHPSSTCSFLIFRSLPSLTALVSD
jgi:hypothetical protein